jgi:hypothetical protein
MNRTGATSRLVIAALFSTSLGTASSCAQGSRESLGDHGASHLAVVEQPARTGPERVWFVRELEAAVVLQNRFVEAVGLSGITAVVAPGNRLAPQDGRAVYVFVRSEVGWREQAKLESPVDFTERMFGSSVAISGDTMIVGAMPADPGGTVSGAAYVYVRSGTTWSTPVPLLADDGEPHHEFGISVAIAGDTAVVGAPSATGEGEDEGAAYVFSRSGSSWTQTKKLFGRLCSLPRRFGESVAISGNTFLVAAPESRMGRGQACLFERSGTSWSEQPLFVPNLYFQMGSSVALDGNIAVVGASEHPGYDAANRMGDRQGAAYVFTKSASAWTQTLELYANDGGDGDRLGTSVAVSGSTLMAGAPGGTPPPSNEDPAYSVYAFDVLLGSEVQHRIRTSDGLADFGASLALDGDIAVVGARARGAHVAELLVPNGGSCDENLDCQDRHCVAGVCCDTACTGACESCVTASARGACRLVPHAPGTPSCAPYLCNETSADCPTSCAVHADCVDDNYCLDARCVERESDGEPCTVARECASGRCLDGACAGTRGIGASCSSATDCESNQCVDGYCCDKPCDGQCEACDVRGELGTCQAVTGAPRGERPPCNGASTECGGECDGEHTVACKYKTSEETCGSSCSNGRQTDDVCDGQGNCVEGDEGDSFSCDGFACADATKCKTSCARFEDCIAGHTCQDERCEPSSTCLNPHLSQDTDGRKHDCTPFLCEEGTCRTSCDVPEDCADDYACRDGDCVLVRPRTEATTSDGGCGCRTAGRRSSEIPWALWACFVAIARIVSRSARSAVARATSRSSRG